MHTIKEFHLPRSAPAIALQEAGEGPLVVFLHGIGGNATNWVSQIQALAGDYMAVAWDMRGYGKSEDYEGSLTEADVCNDLLAILNYYGVSAAHIVGLSMGGMVAQEFYRRHPDMVNSLILANTNAGIGVTFSEKQKMDFVRLRKQPLQEGLEPADLVDPMLKVLLGVNPPQTALENISESIKALHKESYIKAVEAIVEFDSSAVLSTITVPVLLVSGTHDQVIPVASMQAMSQEIAGSRLFVFEGAGHLSNLESPEKFNELMLDFLSQV
jgi:3-oxoadipate enol-lactonase